MILVSHLIFIDNQPTYIQEGDTIMGLFSRTVHVDVDDTDTGPQVRNVRGIGNEGTRHALWSAAQNNVAYTPDGDPSMHPDFERERPWEVPSDKVIFHFWRK